MKLSELYGVSETPRSNIKLHLSLDNGDIFIGHFNKYGDNKYTTEQGGETRVFDTESGADFNKVIAWSYAAEAQAMNDIITDTALNFGGGPWHTLADIMPTVQGMMQTDYIKTKHQGNYVLICSGYQYIQAEMSFYSGLDYPQSALERLESIDSITTVTRSDSLNMDTIVLAQLKEPQDELHELYIKGLVEAIIAPKADFDYKDYLRNVDCVIIATGC